MSAGAVLPPATLGMLGGGQLGRMFTMAARTMGYRVIVLETDPESPAGQIADEHLVAAYTDASALDALAQRCHVVSTEFENAPAETMRRLAVHTRVAPNADAVAIAQDRIREKTFFRDAGLPVGAFAAIEHASDLDAAAKTTGFPALLKTARFGYDGKGQARVESLDALRTQWQEWKGVPCVLEALLPLEREISVVAARGVSGEFRAFPAAENAHARGILDVSLVPARVPKALTERAIRFTQQVADKLDYVGVFAIEWFVVGGHLYANEMAPRPHNSGHYTIDACLTSQFEQQVRAICGLPLGDPALTTPVAMVNLLGDAWKNGEPDWRTILDHPRAKLHLYGKREARPGRKMGHFTVRAASVDAALSEASAIKTKLGV